MINPFLYSNVIDLLDIFARGGGGGSGSGGDGGGMSLIVMIGYLPTHFVTNRAYRHISGRAGVMLGCLTGFMVLTSTAFLMLRGLGEIHVGIMLLVAIGVAIGLYSGTHNWWTRVTKAIKHHKPIIAKAAKKDPVWHETHLKARFDDIFFKYQEDWTSMNFERMQTYTSPEHYHHSVLLLAALNDLGRTNIVAQPSILDWGVMHAKDHADDDYDAFTMYVRAKAYDALVRNEDNSIIFEDDSSFDEFWEFDREGKKWVLKGIEQVTADPSEQDNSLLHFAAQNGMFYKLDMGRLLIPERGRLFGKASFSRSDINNHVIGDWEGLLVQLYTYVPAPSRDRADNYLIGQITLPKSYGGIIVEKIDRSIMTRELITWGSKPWGYQEISMEWPDFNRRYVVYATDMDKVTSFELLNPSFMADLYDRNLDINIEVVDNIVYFYVKTYFATDNYDSMLEVLKRAHKELKR